MAVILNAILLFVGFVALVLGGYGIAMIAMAPTHFSAIHEIEALLAILIGTTGLGFSSLAWKPAYTR